MLSEFEITKVLFEDQIHERFSFVINYQGNEYQGLYHEGVINWFNPQPLNEIGEKQLEIIESKVTEKIDKLLS